MGPQLKNLAFGIDRISQASKTLNGINFSSLTTGVQKLATALQPLSGFKTQASGLIHALESTKSAFDSLDSIKSDDFTVFGQQIDTLTAKMKPLNEISGRLGATLKALNSVSDVANTLKSLNDSVIGADSAATGETRFAVFAKDIERLSKSLAPLTEIKSSVGSLLNTLTRINQASSSLDSVDFTKFAKSIQVLTNALKPLSGVTNKVNTTINALAKLPKVTKELNTINFKGFSQNIETFRMALEPLKQVDTAGFNKTVGALNRVGAAAEKAGDIDFTQLKSSAKSLTSSLKPLQTQANGCAKSFSLFGPRLNGLASGMRGLSKNTLRASSTFNDFKSSLTGSIVKFGLIYAAMHRVSSKLSDFVNESNAYVENLNLFTVAMGDAADEAMNFANVVSNKLGLDPSAFMRYQGILQQITTGFGVLSDKAAVMSKNLTQIGYDISSFFNLGIEDSMQKIQSGISGELEPLTLNRGTMKKFIVKNVVNSNEVCALIAC